MRYLLLISLTMSITLAQFAAAQEVSPDQILKYFPGKWKWTRSDGQCGTVEWKLVCDGKALAGPGMNTFGGVDFGLGGWESSGKKWAHTWYTAKGSYGKLEWTRFDGDTYHGIVRAYEPGSDLTESTTTCKIVDRNTFVLSVEPSLSGTWKRVE